MTADDAFDRASEKLREASVRAAQRGGVAARLARPLSEDSEFVRKLKPSLVAARLRGEQSALDGARAPSGPQLGPRPNSGGRRNAGASPLLIVGAAFAAGILLAKVVDWRGHAHPKH